VQSGDGMTYTFTFTTPGTYSYDCAVHGAAMTGRIVVQ
jgi:plastocyanin